ncbi:thiamine diphosphokinase [Tepidibacter aestuarii]|uniref:thiamine diphosphokinase n=1 Tax=Tepidibacter aestuarii TaxID=2925782 RepID=UPI0020C0CEE5|nr:thiamine diphosphokinase [Tepidibacter aestuarii]CAH2212844.1 thiamine pyrophosphokinase [Tepidibacter aestuarii]
MKSLIIANGSMDDYDFYESIINSYDCIICADGASNHAYNMNINPDIIIGDLDSISDKVKKYFIDKNIEFNKFPSKKDKTDTEICIDYAIDIGSKEIDFIGVLGSRMDHSLANINLLYSLLKKGIKSRIINENNEIYMTDNKIQITGKKGDIVSVIPIHSDALGVTLKGLEYPLEDYDLEFGISLGISNVLVDDKCEISIKSGCVLVIKARD